MTFIKKESKFKKFWNYFTTYEKIWFFSIIILSIAFAFIFPEDDIGGVNGAVIMTLYLLDIILNITCELLISKQSKWNFIVSLGVEITEIVICIVCMYRFSTIATTLFFWIPIDIISFINWNKHKDNEDKELTVVRKLKGWQQALVLTGIAVWTVGIGYLIVYLDKTFNLFDSGILGESDTIKIICIYLDACCSAVGMANGVFILLRYREQWVAWYASTALETAINILSGQWVLLVLKAGYFTNTTYGYIKWTKYIKSHNTKKLKSA